MRQGIRRFFLVIGVLTVAFWGVMLVAAIAAAIAKPGMPHRAYLKLELQGEIPEQAPDGPLYALAVGQTTTVRTIVESLLEAAKDEHIEAVVAIVGPSSLGLAQVQEIRAAVAKVREAGKPTYAFAESLGNKDYYLASAFENLWLQPSGDVELTGLMASAPFAKDLLAKIGVVPRMDHRAEYKTAMNVFTEDRYTPAHRESTESILDSFYEQLTDDIATARKLEPAQIKAFIDGGPHLAQDALAQKLVDQLGYRDELESALKEKLGDAVEPLSLSRYRQHETGPFDHGDTVALVYATGTIVSGEDQGPPWAERNLTVGTLRKALRAAIDDDDVKAIVLRVDSPGGSYVASDAIWRETLRAKEKQKPLVVSMGNVAGSGGYFIALGADSIVAEPATITGSIGVVGGKMLVRGLFDKVGVTFDSVQRGAAADYASALHDFSPEEWKRLETSLDAVYADFKDKVGKARKLSPEQVEALAKGRIWTGAQAKTNGLVDALGGLTDAVDIAKKLAAIDATADVTLRVYPAPKSTFEMLFSHGDDEAVARVLVTTKMARELRALKPLISALGLEAPLGRVEMPVVPEVR